MDLMQALIVGSYVFSAGCYLFVWKLFEELTRVRMVAAALATRVDNHHEHALDDLKHRVQRLERGE